jgi:RNA polymerase sigma-70 factor (ECF subfamily)
MKSGDPQRESPRAESDRELVERARSGQRPAFERLVQRYAGSLFVYVLSRVANRYTAEDVIQETFFVAYRDLHRLRSGDRFAGWIFGTADRLAARSRRSLVREKRALEGAWHRGGAGLPGTRGMPATAEAADGRAARADEQQRLLEALDHLPRRYRIPIILRYFEDLNSAEIGQRLAAPAATVRSWLLRGNRLLKRHLEQRGGAPRLAHFEECDGGASAREEER